MFKCDKDSDIETFLHDKAINHLERGICNVFLILDEAEFDNNNIKVLAYYTLSHRSVGFHDETSKTKIKDVSGFKDRISTHVVLIGQLGKYISNGNSAELCISDILEFAFETIRASNELIPCRAVLIECSETIHNLQIYENEGFKFLQIDNDFYQYYKILD